jgi:hypothetical protein
MAYFASAFLGLQKIGNVIVGSTKEFAIEALFAKDAVLKSLNLASAAIAWALSN